MYTSKESFKPKSNTPPIGFLNSIRFQIRLCLDLQTLSAYRHLKEFLQNTNGQLLDVGCGASPYRFLINENSTHYFGLDIADADEKFNYNRKDIYSFDGGTIPFPENHFNFLICTEVLEHVENYQLLVDEIYRVLKSNGKALITIPWSARFHYIPYDYFRYTPTTLLKMFNHFKDIEIIPRGTDVTSIAAKLIVLFVRNILPNNLLRYLFIPFWLIASPIVIIGMILGHISLVTRFGNDSDPLGYTILVKK